MKLIYYLLEIFLHICVCTHLCYIWSDCVTYCRITDNITKLHKKQANFSSNFIFDVWLRFDNPYLAVTIQEVAKFNDFLKKKTFFSEKDSNAYV